MFWASLPYHALWTEDSFMFSQRQFMIYHTLLASGKNDTSLEQWNKKQCKIRMYFRQVLSLQKKSWRTMNHFWDLSFFFFCLFHVTFLDSMRWTCSTKALIFGNSTLPRKLIVWPDWVQQNFLFMAYISGFLTLEIPNKSSSQLWSIHENNIGIYF